MKSILNKAFWNLLLSYSFMIFAIALGFFWKYSLHFQIFALIIAFVGVFSFEKKKEKKQINLKRHYLIFFLILVLIILFRSIPYIGNSIPLGYDPGIYKYGIEHGLQNLDKWIVRGGMEPGFLYLMKPLSLLLSIEFIFTKVLIIFCVLLGWGVYFVVKEFSDKRTALIAILIYAFSIVQFKAFWYMYYKNIIGMCLMLFSLCFLKKSEINKKYLGVFILLGGLIGAIHRPTFYIFGISYFIFTFVSPYKKKSYNLNVLKMNILAGIGIILIAGIFYLGKFSQAITIMFEPVLQGFLSPGESAGTFINFFTYQFSSLFYLPLALLGLFYLIKKKDFNVLVIWALVNLAIVYFQFFFFNRFIIFLDLVMVILASFGASELIRQKEKLGKLILAILLISAAIFAFNESINSKPLVNTNELSTIQCLNNTEANAFVMSTDSYYSTWIQGYSERKTIAPGLFDYDNHSKSDWMNFWTANNLSEINQFLSFYPRPLYIFIGERQKDNLAQFQDCFNKTYELENNKIYHYLC